jgi:hypothetical protein
MYHKKCYLSWSFQFTRYCIYLYSRQLLSINETCNLFDSSLYISVCDLCSCIKQLLAWNEYLCVFRLRIKLPKVTLLPVYLRFQDLTAVNLLIVVFGVPIPYSLVDGLYRFRGMLVTMYKAHRSQPRSPVKSVQNF